MSNLIRNTITSMEAKMVGKEHSKLLRDIRNYVVQLGEAKIGFTDFFKEATYTTEQNKILPCFQVTKKGCEFIAHKLTGQKGTEFTARYINRFHEMEDGKLPCPLNPIIASSVAELGRVTDRIMTKQGSAPYKIAEVFKRECEQFGISLPEDFVKVPEYEQMRLQLETNQDAGLFGEECVMKKKYFPTVCNETTKYGKEKFTISCVGNDSEEYELTISGTGGSKYAVKALKRAIEIFSGR